ncbi:phosphatase PAP2 family protein [Burkholderia alba]|uniref:phosphatase PAP2 family protein n=1 Tax=Burkholderia alba TaxID=2683677 RepID=UPI002B058D45|nr:phosphatase PAP2 family protein [Burkholderia alba]
MSLLLFLTHFGDPYMTAPLAAAVLGWLAATGRRRAAIEWGAGMACAVGLVALSKFVYAGWGIGIDALQFTGVSGHTMLSAAVYPLVAAICARDERVRAAAWGGLSFALAIGLSRVLLGFHSWSEIVSGGVLGAGVAAMTLRRMRVARGVLRDAAGPAGDRTAAVPRAAARSAHARATVCFAAAAFAIVVLSYGRTAPVSAWISVNAPKMAEWSRVWFDDIR